MGRIEKSTRATETPACLDRIERSAGDLPSAIPGRQPFEASANLDLLRSIAIGCVLVAHGLERLGIRSARLEIGALGFAGVLMFFVHTSFVLMMSLDRQHARSPRAGSFRGFLIRRVLRIYPLSVTAVLASFLLATSRFVPQLPLRPGELLANLTLVQNVTGARSRPGALWTLPVEMQMYLAFPALHVLARASRKIGPWLSAWAVSAAVIWAMGGFAVMTNPLQFVPCFLPGIIAYIRRDVPRTLSAFWLPCASTLFALLYAVLVMRGVPEEILAPCFCLALGLLLPKMKELSSARVAQVARVVATYSYALYLVHGDLMWIAVTHGATWPAAFRAVVFSVALVLLAFLAHHVIERPGMRLGVALERRWTGREAASE